MISYEELMSMPENNTIFCTINENDVQLANHVIKMIEKAREDNDKPVVGDIVKYTDKFGRVYPDAKIASIEGENINIAILPYSEVSLKNNKLIFKIKGYEKEHIDASNLKKIGKIKAPFDINECVNGKVINQFVFRAKVNSWVYTDPQYIERNVSTQNCKKIRIYCTSNSKLSFDRIFNNITKICNR